MKIHRFFLNNSLGEDLVLKEKIILHRIINVLKLKITENLIIFNNFENFDYVYSIKKISKHEIVLLFISKIIKKSNRFSKISINLCVSMIKKENFDLIFEKCTEIGVSKFSPIISDRTEKKHILSFNPKKVEKNIIGAIEQSDQNIIPTVNNPYKIRDFIDNIIKNEKKSEIYILDLYNFSNFNLKKIKKQHFLTNKIKNIYLFIGPEGGWTEKERSFFNKNKLKVLTLGETSLRSETTAIIASWIFKNFLFT